MADTTVPLISLGELRQGIHDEEFCRWVAENGVFYLTENGVSEEDHRQATEVAMDFFTNSTAEEKQAVTTKVATIRRGYSGLEAESTAIVTNSGQYSDYSMSFSMGTSDNLFPSPLFESVWKQYFDRLYGVAQQTRYSVPDAAAELPKHKRLLRSARPLPCCAPADFSWAGSRVTP